MFEEKYLNQIVERFDKSDVEDNELIQLIKLLVNSGMTIKYNRPVFDFASTGGPSSLSTLLVPLYLYGYNARVINLAVPGRPAGAVDVLAQIPNYNLHNIKHSYKQAETFYIHLETNENFVPMDKALFEYRKKVNKVNVPNLAIASILAKKVAVGASDIGLDVRVSNFGNFGKDWNECIVSAKKFNRLAEQMGIHSTCFLSNANIPYQNYIGRGEALEALYDIFSGKAEQQLHLHDEYCKNIAECLIRKAGMEIKDAYVDISKYFERNLISQGSTYKDFERKVDNIKHQEHYIFQAEKYGYITYNLESMRDYIVSRQMEEKNITEYPDPCGIKLLCRTGEFVAKGTPIISIRSNKSIDNRRISQMYSLQSTEPIINRKKEVV